MDARDAEPPREEAAGAGGLEAKLSADAGVGEVDAIATRTEVAPDAQLAERVAANG